MKIKNFLKEYWHVFHANTYNGKRLDENLIGFRIALLIMAGFSVILTVMNIFTREYDMVMSSITLGILYIATYLVERKTRKYKTPIIVCLIGTLAVLTYYILSGGSDGFAVVWTLLAPMFVMSSIGVKAGTFVSAYLQIVLVAFFWTPLRFIVDAHYSEIFMTRFPILFFCAVIVSLSVMLSHKKQQMQLDAYQDKLEKSVKDERDRAAQITFQTIGAIISLVDAKDPYTDDHSLRVAQYSLMIADEMGWDSEDAEKLYYIALLHDIGKVGVHDAILKKTSKLNDTEYQIMKTHTSIGATILREMTFLDNVDIGALYHHEKYDGTGYPFGLKGDEIPMTARILCLADSFDAMNTVRVYRDKCDESYIIEEIRKGRGTQFDPDVVDAFFRCVEKNRINFAGV